MNTIQFIIKFTLTDFELYRSGKNKISGFHFRDEVSFSLSHWMITNKSMSNITSHLFTVHTFSIVTFYPFCLFVNSEKRGFIVWRNSIGKRASSLFLREKKDAFRTKEDPRNPKKRWDFLNSFHCFISRKKRENLIWARKLVCL